MRSPRVEPAEVQRVVRRVKKQLNKLGCVVMVKVSESGSHYINAMKRYSNGVGFGFQVRVSNHPEGSRRRKADFHWHGQMPLRVLLEQIVRSVQCGHVVKSQG